LQLQDLEYLATHPISKDAMSDRQTPESEGTGRRSDRTVSRAQSKQLLERHSLIRLANFVNDSPYPTDPQLPPPASIASLMRSNEAYAPAQALDTMQRQAQPQMQFQQQNPHPSGSVAPEPPWSPGYGSASSYAGPSAPMALMEESSFSGVFPIPDTAPANLGQWEGALQAPWDHLDFLINPNVYPQGAFEYFGAAGFG
jgi:hypothetical protein